MDRLQKKCVIASAGVHLLLGLILLVGPALAPQSRPDNMPVLDFVPFKTVDALVSGGGNPDAKPLAITPPAPQPQPPSPAPAQPPAPPERIREPAPAPVPVRVVQTPALKPDPDSLEPNKETKPRRPDVSTTLVKRSAQDRQAQSQAQAEADARAQARAAANARQRLANQIGQIAENIGNSMSGSTTIELRGPGGGGVPYANFLQAVKSAYMRALVIPDNLANRDAVTEALVTIARDGTVVSARIVRYSGDAGLDNAVQKTLDRVKDTAPLPDDAKEEQRTVQIYFSPKTTQPFG